MVPRIDGSVFADLVATVPVYRQLDRPVFTDPSGRRVEVLQWGSRGFCLLAAALCTAVAMTLQTHVTMPGLAAALLGSSREIKAAAENPPAATTAVPVQTELGAVPTRTGVAGHSAHRSGHAPDSAGFPAAGTHPVPVPTTAAGKQRGQQVSGTRAGATTGAVASPRTTAAAHATVSRQRSLSPGGAGGSSAGDSRSQAGGKGGNARIPDGATRSHGTAATGTHESTAVKASQARPATARSSTRLRPACPGPGQPAAECPGSHR